MISSLVFSLIAFFIVSTTTFIIISNQSKVNNIKTTLKDNKDYILNNTAKQDKKVLELVNEVNLKHKDLQFENKKTKDEFKKKTTKVDNKIDNLDKVFNSYKNITTANFMGMNNRVSKEFSRIDEAADKLKKKVYKNEENRKEKDNDLLKTINANESDFIYFKNNRYSKKVGELSRQDLLLDEKINKINENLNQSVIDSSNLTYDARSLIKSDVQKKYSDVQTSLNSFFGIDYDSPFVTVYSSVTAQTNSNNNFNNWFNSNYNFDEKLNFKSMNEMIGKTDVNMTTVQSLNTNVINLNTSNSVIFDKLSNDSNLYKDNFHSYMNDTYNFDVNKLEDIAKNEAKITEINKNIASLSNSLNDIGIFDVTVGGTITLEKLHQSIMSNQILIDSNVALINRKFDSEFGSYLENNIKPKSLYITSNLDQAKLLEKLENTDLDISLLTTSNISVNDDISLNGYSLSNTIENNSSRVQAFDNIFDLRSYDHKIYPNEINEDVLNKSMMTFINDSMETSRRLDTTDDGYKPRQILVNPGVNMFLQRDKIMPSDDNPTLGGRLFVDSFDDIGIADRDFGHNLTKLTEQTRSRNLQFKLDDTNNSSLTLGNALSNLGKRIEENASEINNIQTNNVTKTQLYNTIHNDDLKGDYNSPGTGGGYGKYDDYYQNGFRIDNLYTGSFAGNDSCRSDSLLGDKRCETIQDRLKTLEDDKNSDKSSAEAKNFKNFMINYGDDEEDYDIGKTNLKQLNLKYQTTSVDGVLKAKTNTEIGGTLSVSGHVYIGDGESKLFLRQAQDLRKVASDGGDGGNIFDDYIQKKDNYINNLDLTGNVLSWEKSDNSSGTNTGSITLPTSMDITKRDKSDYCEIYDIVNSSDQVSETDMPIYNPLKYSYVTYDDNILNIKQIHGGRSQQNDIQITIPEIDRNSLLNELAESTPGESIKPYFPSGIKIGDGCIKVASGKLQICDSTCEPSSCTPVWDHRQARDPTGTITS